MSFEFQPNIDRPLPPASLPRLKDYLVRNTAFDIVRDIGAEFALADRTKNRRVWSEDLLIVIDSNRAYIAFHSLKRDERKAFLTVVTKALGNEGIMAAFEEL
jgi:hypothetical protein